MSDRAMSEPQSLMIRERDLSNAAARHLLAEKGSPANLAAAMLVDVKRMKAGLDARISADLLAVDIKGNFRLLEAKRHRPERKEGFIIWLTSFRKGRHEDSEAA